MTDKKQLVIARADGSTRIVAGYKAASPKEHAKKFAAKRTGALPPKVDLRPFMTEIEDQEETNSCVANAVAGAYEYVFKRYRREDVYDVSRMFIYYNGRWSEEEDIEDEGSVIEQVIQGLCEYGACAEETWPFDVAAVNEEPSAEAYEEAAQFLIEDTASVPNDLAAWKHALSEGHPIIFGLSLFKSFDAHRKMGLVPLPSQAEAGRGAHAGHAMLCVGYSDADRIFIVRNSWGVDWGDKGYCYIPYDYILNAQYNDGDSWIIRRVEELPSEDLGWGDDSSIVPDFEHELANMDEDDYAAMLEAMGDVPLETRLALVFLTAAGADGDLTDAEIDSLAEVLTVAMEKMGSHLAPAKVLKHASRRLGDRRLVDESIGLFAEHFSNGMLATIVSQVTAIASADDLNDTEQEFIDRLVSAWQIEDEEDEEGDDDEEEEEEEGEGSDEDEDEESDEDEDEESDEDEDEESDEDEDEESDEDEDEGGGEDDDEESDEDEDEGGGEEDSK